MERSIPLGKRSSDRIERLRKTLKRIVRPRSGSETDSKGTREYGLLSESCEDAKAAKIVAVWVDIVAVSSGAQMLPVGLSERMQRISSPSIRRMVPS